MALLQTVADLGSCLAQPKLHVVSCFFIDNVDAAVEGYDVLFFFFFKRGIVVIQSSLSIVELWCCLSLLVRCWRVSPGRAEMLFGKEEKAPSLPPCLLRRNTHRPKLPSKKAGTLRKIGAGLKRCGLGPLCLSKARTLSSSCRLYSSPASVMHSWWHTKILNTVPSAITSFFLDGHFVCGEYSMVLSCLSRNEHWMKWNFLLCDIY